MKAYGLEWTDPITVNTDIVPANESGIFIILHFFPTSMAERDTEFLARAVCIGYGNIKAGIRAYMDDERFEHYTPKCQIWTRIPEDKQIAEKQRIQAKLKCRSYC